MSAMTIPLQLYFEGSVSTVAAATIFTPVRARISALLLEISVDQVIASDIRQAMEISFQSTTQRQTNDATGVLGALQLTYLLVTTGAALGSERILINNIDILWEQGQRIYMHTFSSASSSAEYKAIVYTNR